MTTNRQAVPFSLCDGAGLRICDSCHRHAERHPAAAANPLQPRFAPSRSSRCANWKAAPTSTRGAITPTDRT